MKKIVVLFLTAIAFVGWLQAKPVDVGTAKALGIKFMNVNTKIKSTETELTYTAVVDNGLVCFYVFSVHPKGFVIVSADDRMRPVLGYSTESNFTAQLPDGLMTFFDNYKAGFVQMVENDDVRTEEAIADWTCLAETGRINDVRITREVAPLLRSIWNQTDLYNNMAPEDPNSVYSGHCKAGCVANGMSQVMRYWEWPRHGQGGHGYDASSYYGDYGWQEANFENATYQFELMPDFLDFASPQGEVDATALIEYHAGISVDMGYGPNASGAYSGDVGPAMQEYFRYSPDWQYRSQSSYQNQWTNMLRSNLNSGMPLYYASSGPDGGHAYVLDGYDSNNLFHVNWGWAGFDNGWYAIDGFYLTFYSFPWNHSAVFNLHPMDEYYDAPMAVEMEASAIGVRRVELEFNPVFETRGGEEIDEMDIYIMRDGVVIDSLLDWEESWGSGWSIYWDDVEKSGTYYYAIYAVNEAGMSKVTRDTVVVGSNCDVRFELADSGNNGWDMSFIAVLDEDGKVSQRVGLMDGGSASITVPVPNDQTATFFWTYDNTCYSHGSLEEVSYEIYDWDDNLIVASDGYPEVGEIIDYEIGCSMDCRPVFDLEGAYAWHNPDEFGVELNWDWDGNVEEFGDYRVIHNGLVVWSYPFPEQKSCFIPCDESGIMDYEVVVVYYREGGEVCQSEGVHVTVEVTSVQEHSSVVSLYPNPVVDHFTVEGKIKEIKVFDALGQLMHQGTENTVDVSVWPEGVYIVRIVDENDMVSVVKLLKK